MFGINKPAFDFKSYLRVNLSLCGHINISENLLKNLNTFMTSEAIEKLVESGNNSDKPMNIHFKQRNTIRGLFIKGNDYKDLRSKNFWRIVTNANIELWEKTKDVNLARIFNGAEFTKLSNDK